MITINLLTHVGHFAENKDIARNLRMLEILPALQRKERVILDFGGVDGATQSFVHALISEALQHYGFEALDYIQFRDCNQSIRQIISIVTEYLQESL